MNSLKNRRIGIAALLALSAALALSGLAAHRALRAARPAPALLALKRVADIPLPGGATRFDYESIDPNRRLLYIAHLGDAEIVVFDLRASQVTARIGDVSSVHGVLAVTELSRVYASATGTDEVVAIDARTRKIVARIPGGRYPDGMAYAPEAFKLYVSDKYGETETVIDTRTNRRIATIALGGEAGNTQYDPSSRHVFVNDQTHARLVEIDPALDRIVNRFDLPGAKGNHGLLIDPRDRLAFIACEGNDKLLILDTHRQTIRPPPYPVPATILKTVSVLYRTHPLHSLRHPCFDSADEESITMNYLTLSALPAGMLFALVTSITPGPNNTMLLASGVNFGFRRTLPHMFGISAGVAILMLSVGFGLGEAFKRIPILYTLLETASVVYLLYLAWRIGTSGEVRAHNGKSRPMTFVEAIAFQWVNPKAWMMVLTAATTIQLSADYGRNAVWMALVFVFVGLPCISVWAAFGQGLRGFLSNPRWLRVFNLTMATLLVLSLYPMFAKVSGH